MAPSSLLQRLVVALLAGLGSALFGCGDGGYQRKGGQWLYEDQAFTPLDAASFKPLDARFARDAQAGYYRGSAIAGSHGGSFTVLGDHEARDERAVYYADTYRKGQEYWSVRHLRIEAITGADTTSYRVLGHGYASDRARAYFEGRAFPVRDVASFVPLNAGFAHDRQRGYFELMEIAGSDGSSFELVDASDYHHARDARHAYYGDTQRSKQPNVPSRPVVKPLQDAHVAQLRVLGRGYASDGQHVWHRGRLVADADAASFALLETFSSEADAQDRSGAFADGRRVAPTKP